VLADDVARWADLWDEATLESALRALPVFVEKAGTGGGLFRRLQAVCCHDVASRTGSPFSRAAGEAYERCGHAWSALGAAARAEESLAARAARVTRAAAELPALEAEAAEALKCAAAELRG
jgi:hypothetical protein